MSIEKVDNKREWITTIVLLAGFILINGVWL